MTEQIETPAAAPIGRKLESVLPTALFILLLCLWTAGVKVKTPARISAVLTILYMLIRRPAQRNVGFPADSALRILLTVFPALFCLLVGLHQSAGVFLGEQGIDFAVFSQAIRSVAVSGRPITTLLADRPVDFLTHHFTPILYPIGWIAALGVPAYAVGVLCHTAATAAALHAAWLICRATGFSPLNRALLVTLAAVNPGFRMGLLWGIHDETFALPVLGYSVFYWVSGRPRAAAGVLCLAALFKETFLLLMAWSLPVFWAAAAWENGTAEARRTARAFLPTALIGLGGAGYYFLLRPHFQEVTFDFAARLATLSELMQTEALAAKLWYLATIFVPTLMLSLFSAAGLCLTALAAPFLGMSLISNFAEMYAPYNYYAVVPSYLICLGAILTLGRRLNPKTALPPAAALLALCLSFYSDSAAKRPLKTVRRLFTEPLQRPETLDFIPADARVIASDYDAVFVLDKRQVIRLWVAARLPVAWDRILVRKPPREEVAPSLLKHARPCFENKLWRVLCRR